MLEKAGPTTSQPLLLPAAMTGLPRTGSGPKVMQ